MQNHPSDIESLFLSQLGLVEEVVRFVARRHRLTAPEAEEFGSLVKLRLIEHDYGVLRAFQGRSSLRTYLVTVVQRLFLDHRAAQWGRWRPSAVARRLGPAVVELERLVTRDGMTVDEAIETLRSNRGVQTAAAELRDVIALLPGRASRRVLNEEAAGEIVDPSPGPDSRVLAEERRRAADRIAAALDRALQELEPRERLILRLRFQESFSVIEIARMVGDDSKQLYRSLDKLMGHLRKAMETQGISESEVASVMGEGVDMAVRLDPGKTADRSV